MRRPRRNRQSSAIRAMAQETRLHPSDLIQPYFVLQGTGCREAVGSMPGIERLSADLVIEDAKQLMELGVPAIILFAYVDAADKDETGSESLNPRGVIPEAIRQIKKALPELCVIADIALDPFTSHGHDGLVDTDGRVLNDETVAALASCALVFAEAGADMVAPSDMMDGRVGRIREVLDERALHRVSIMAYSVKYTSAFYGPFRDALASAPRFGDKKGYQMNPANRREAVLECLLDEAEHADFLMIKPALPYLDVIAAVCRETTLPVAAYQVSGEYSMIMAAAERGWIDGSRALYESALSIKRAGASQILTYACRELAQLIRQHDGLLSH